MFYLYKKLYFFVIVMDVILVLSIQKLVQLRMLLVFLNLILIFLCNNTKKSCNHKLKI